MPMRSRQDNRGGCNKHDPTDHAKTSFKKSVTLDALPDRLSAIGNNAVQRALQPGKSSAQRQDGNHAGSLASVRNMVNAPGSGLPIPNAVRRRIEPLLNADLSAVRVHSGADAHQAALALNARAFTNRSHIWLGRGQSANDVRLMAHEATHTVQPGSSRIYRWKWPWESDEKPKRLKSSGLASRWKSLKPRLALEFKRNAKRKLDQIVADIKTQTVKVQDLRNRIKLLRNFRGSDKWTEQSSKQLTIYERDLKRENFKLSELKERAIDLAVIAYDIDTKYALNLNVPNMREDEEQQEKDRVHGITDKGHVIIYHSAFNSAALLGSVIAHESEVHARQYAEGREYDDRIGYILNEIEALDHELVDAARFGLNQEEIEEINRIREEQFGKLEALSPAYAQRARHGNYSL